MTNYEDRLHAAMAAQIKVELAERAMDQKDLAEAIGIHAVTMTKYMKGQRVPSMSTIFRIAEVLSISPSVLMERAEARAGE